MISEQVYSADLKESVDPKELDKIIESLTSLSDSALTIYQRITQCNDRHFGCAPKTAGESKAKDGDGTISNINEAVNVVSTQLQYISEELNRYESL